MLNSFSSSDLSSIYWDGSRQRFVDADTGRLVSNLIGIQTLSQVEISGGLRFVDARNHFAPDPINLNYPSVAINFLNRTRTWSPSGFDEYNQRAPVDSYHVSVFTYLDDTGHLRISSLYSSGGSPINARDERRRMAGIIASEMGLAMGAEGSDKIMQRVTMNLHYYAH